MKLFMMPHTVPNRPTKGAVEPMVASTPVPLFMSRAAAASSRASRDATRSLMPSRSAASDGQAQLVRGRRDERRNDAATGADRAAAPASDRSSPMAASARAQPAPRHEQFDALGQPDRPGDDRGEGQADHHGLHDDVGGGEHRPWREVARQVHGADHTGGGIGGGWRAGSTALELERRIGCPAQASARRRSPRPSLRSCSSAAYRRLLLRFSQSCSRPITVRLRPIPCFCAQCVSQQTSRTGNLNATRAHASTQ